MTGSKQDFTKQESDLDRVAAVLVAVALRLVKEEERRQGGAAENETSDLSGAAESKGGEETRVDAGGTAR